MNQLRRSAIASLLIVAGFAAGSATAVVPDSGWYYAPALPEQGFNVEIQNNTLFVAGFIYDTSGNPIWVIAGGPMQSDHTFSGPLFKTANGQPIGGAPRTAVESNYGTISLNWVTTTTINATVNGTPVSLTRELFGFDFTSNAQPLLGELSFVEGFDGLYFGDRLTFTHTASDSTGLYAVGYASGDTTRTAVGSYAPSLNKWTILFDSSINYYNYYTFIFEGVNFVEGDNFTYMKGSTPGGSLPFVGSRTKSAQAVVGQDAPGSTKSAPADTTASDALRAKKISAQGGESKAIDLAVLGRMEALLESLR